MKAGDVFQWVEHPPRMHRALNMISSTTQTGPWWYTEFQRSKRQPEALKFKVAIAYEESLKLGPTERRKRKRETRREKRREEEMGGGAF